MVLVNNVMILNVLLVKIINKIVYYNAIVTVKDAITLKVVFNVKIGNF